MEKITAFVILVASCSTIIAQHKDKMAIKAMCGCYSVTFNYAETFPEDTAYKIHVPYHAKASAEWIFVEEETKSKIVIQHLLVVSETLIIKHWRQDWLYENTNLYQFDKNLRWKFTQLPADKVKGQWTQKVYQVDDSPRYEGNMDGKHYLESTTDAPLPRREFSKRDDYNVLQRTNRHIITDYGWLHEQDNLKIIRNGTKDSAIVAEKGLNKYTKIDNIYCKPAIAWWKQFGLYWSLVRIEWNNVFDQNKSLQLANRRNNKPLWQALFDLSEKLISEAEENPDMVGNEIRSIIHLYLNNSIEKENTTY